MSTEPRTATVSVLITKSLEVDEPDWCAGHADGMAQFKADITHYGPAHATEANGIETLRAQLVQSPYSKHAPGPVLYVERGDITGSYTPDEVEELARSLEQSAALLRALGQQLAVVLEGGAT